VITSAFTPTAPTAQPPAQRLPSTPILLPPLPAPVSPTRATANPITLLGAFLKAVLTGIAAALALAFVASTVLGFQHFTVMSGSMEPTISPGDVVVDKRIRPVTARIGDIVTFRDPKSTERLITHRITAMRVADGTVFFTTKGDANNDVQKWTAPASGSVGRVELAVPKAGYLLFWIGRPWGRITLIVLPLLLLGAYEVRQTLRGDDDSPRPQRGSHRPRHAKRA
jgi:signal peptidase